MARATMQVLPKDTLTHGQEGLGIKLLHMQTHNDYGGHEVIPQYL